MAALSIRRTAAFSVACTALLLPSPAPAGQAGFDATQQTLARAYEATTNRTGAVRTGDAERATTAELRTAAALRRFASRLYDRPARWTDVAVLHAHAASLSGFEGDEASRDLVLAGNLLWGEGERRYACAALRTAGMIALRAGEPRRSDAAFRNASRVGTTDCERHLDEFLETRIVPAPPIVRVAAPDHIQVGIEEAKLEPVLRRPDLPVPALGMQTVRIPAVPGPVRVAPPSIQLPAVEEAVIRPDLSRPVLEAPPLPHRGEGVR